MLRAASLWRAAWGFLALHVAIAVILWFDLPARVPLHFGLTGTPDAWTGNTAFAWFGLLAVSLALGLFVHAIAFHGPLQLWNIPEKERFLRMEATRREPVLDLLRAIAALSVICSSITLIALQVGIYLTAHGITPGLSWQVGGVMIAAMVVLLVGTIAWSRQVKRAILRASAEE